jgi:hypothetical protein
MEASADLTAQLVALERELLDQSLRKSRRADVLLAESFLEFGSSGRRLERAQVLAGLQTETPSAVEADGFEVSLLARTVALVTYRSFLHSVPTAMTLRSSIWRLEGEHWRMVFHQGTRAPGL